MPAVRAGDLEHQPDVHRLCVAPKIFAWKHSGERGRKGGIAFL